MSISGKQAALDFRQKYGVLIPSLEEIRHILTLQGYSVVEFSPLFNDGQVGELLRELELQEYVLGQNGFTFANRNHRIIFLNEDLSQDEQRLVLLHEQGHIFCGHMEERPIMGREVFHEQEANSFLYHMENPSLSDRLCHLFRRHKGIMIATGVLAVVLATACVVTVVTVDRKHHTPTYAQLFVVDGGTYYHQSGCIAIRDRLDPRPLTREEYESNLFAPCSVCLP